MTLLAEPIRTVVIEVLEDALPDTFAYGAFAGQPIEAQQAMARQTAIGAHWFDVELAAEEVHASSPVSALHSRRVMQVEVTIPIISHVPTTAQETERALILNAIASDADDAAQALSVPGALAATGAAVVTEIVSGLMFGPGRSGTPTWSLVTADWERQLIRSTISGSLVVVAEA